MKKIILGLLFTATLVIICPADANAESRYKRVLRLWQRNHEMATPWHGQYYSPSFGVPRALVVPPTANTTRSLGWGVSSSQMRTIIHQYRPGMGASGAAAAGTFYPTPANPQNTRQFGIYYIRGPW